MRRLLLACGVAVLLAAVGCDDVKFKGEMRRVTLETVPTQARVYHIHPFTRNKALLGHTPLKEHELMVLTSLKTQGHLPPSRIGPVLSDLGVAHVIIEKEGFKPYEGRLGTKEDETVSHEVALVPLEKPPAEKP